MILQTVPLPLGNRSTMRNNFALQTQEKALGQPEAINPPSPCEYQWC